MKQYKIVKVTEEVIGCKVCKVELNHKKVGDLANEHGSLSLSNFKAVWCKGSEKPVVKFKKTRNKKVYTYERESKGE